MSRIKRFLKWSWLAIQNKAPYQLRLLAYQERYRESHAKQINRNNNIAKKGLALMFFWPAVFFVGNNKVEEKTK